MNGIRNTLHNINDRLLYRYLLARAVVREKVAGVLAAMQKDEGGYSEVTWLLLVFGAMGVILVVYAVYRAVVSKGHVVVGQIEGLEQPR
jgi:hypothetical protein